MDKRSYLRSLGFTVGERGRFSAEMLAALAAAPAGAVDADAPKAAPKKVTVATIQKALRETPEGQAVVNGAQRAAEALARREAKPTVSQQTAARPSPLLMPKRRPEGTGYTTVKGILIRQSQCGNCRVQVNRCACKEGPRAYKWLEKEVGGPLTLVLDKPDALTSL